MLVLCQHFPWGFVGAHDEHHCSGVVCRSASRLPTHFMAEWQSRFDGSWLRRPATQTDLVVVITDAKTYTHSAFNIGAHSIYYALLPREKELVEEGKDTGGGGNLKMDSVPACQRPFYLEICSFRRG